jgi:hypothetical protein
MGKKELKNCLIIFLIVGAGTPFLGYAFQYLNSVLWGRNLIVPPPPNLIIGAVFLGALGVIIIAIIGALGRADDKNFRYK